eukprot:scaffold315673_cov31-Tisochrysis_lutea.AAC.1
MERITWLPVSATSTVPSPHTHTLDGALNSALLAEPSRCPFLPHPANGWHALVSRSNRTNLLCPVLHTTTAPSGSNARDRGLSQAVLGARVETSGPPPRSQILRRRLLPESTTRSEPSGMVVTHLGEANVAFLASPSREPT